MGLRFLFGNKICANTYKICQNMRVHSAVTKQNAKSVNRLALHRIGYIQCCLHKSDEIITKWYRIYGN